MTSIAELEAKQITYTLQHHSGSAHTAAQAAEVLGVEVKQIVKTLLLIGKITGPVVVLATGDQRLDLIALRDYFHDRRLHLANSAEVLDITGYPVGLVTPLGLKAANLPIYATSQVAELPSCIISSGQRNTEIQLQVSDLLGGIKAKILYPKVYQG